MSCEGCQGKAAEQVCCCTWPLRNFCSECMKTHKLDDDDDGYKHRVFPVNYCSTIDNEEQYDEFMKRNARYEFVKKTQKKRTEEASRMTHEWDEACETAKNSIEILRMNYRKEVDGCCQDINLEVTHMKEDVKKLLMDTNSQDISQLAKTSWDYITERKMVFKPAAEQEKRPAFLKQWLEENINQLLNVPEDGNVYMEKAEMVNVLEGKLRQAQTKIDNLATELGDLREKNRRLEIVVSSKWKDTDFDCNWFMTCMCIPYCFCWPLVGLSQCQVSENDGNWAMVEGCLLPICCCCVGAAINRQRIQAQRGEKPSFLKNLLCYFFGFCNICLTSQEKNQVGQFH